MFVNVQVRVKDRVRARGDHCTDQDVETMNAWNSTTANYQMILMMENNSCVS